MTTLSFSKILSILIVSPILFQVQCNEVTITSKECNALMYFKDMKLDGSIVTVEGSGDDICKINDSGVRDFTVGVKDKGDYIFSFSIKNGYYSLTSIKDSKDSTYYPTKGSAASYTITPSSKLNSAFACSLTALKTRKHETTRDQKTILSKDQSTIKFSEFSVQLNNPVPGGANVDFVDYTGHINQCVGFLSAETLLGIVSLILVIGISLFAAWMLSGIDTMDKFEDPKLRPFAVPLEAKS